MAGAGFKDFTVGEILTSSDVDTYLMQQSVMRFADAAARGSALGTATGAGTALAEGMVSYLDDVNDVQVYDGSGWRVAGSLVATKFASFTGTQTNSTASAASFDITSLSITHTVANSANKVILLATVGVLGTNQGATSVGLGFAVGGTLIDIGATAGSRVPVASGGSADNSGNTATSGSDRSIQTIYTPGAGSKTYTVRAINVSPSTQTVYVNRLEDDTDAASRPRGFSSLILMEVKV